MDAIEKMIKKMGEAADPDARVKKGMQSGGEVAIPNNSPAVVTPSVTNTPPVDTGERPPPPVLNTGKPASMSDADWNAYKKATGKK